jgi:hypothetical protein
MRIFKSTLMYFTLVFGTGFLLALIRIPLLVPKFGVRAAELMEMPIMLLVIYFAARWIVRRQTPPPSPAARFAIGLLALALLLCTEFSVVLWLQGLTIAQAIANRDPVSGSAYALSLALFAAMPLLVARKTGKTL